MTSPYTEPQVDKDAFNCPHCGAYATQDWGDVLTKSVGYIDGFKGARCFRCQEFSIWAGESMIYPATAAVAAATQEMPEVVKRTYEEARSIVNASPRAAAALLRLAIQQLMVDLALPGKNLNQDIGTLVKQGLPEKAVQALDAVRVIGNNAVHPGEIDMEDNRPVAVSLFALVNLIVDVAISRPRQVDEIYGKLPAGAIEGIERRDGKTNTP